MGCCSLQTLLEWTRMTLPTSKGDYYAHMSACRRVLTDDSVRRAPFRFAGVLAPQARGQTQRKG